ncbi:Hypothetical protein D9617_17g048070 [Elsinoe fawcettii]|nr:Hypothetical protein D9617_17g048070 [Elsinoe fawcettii]
MRFSKALPLAAAFASVSAFDLSDMISAEPELAEQTVSINRLAIAESIVSKMQKIKPTPAADPQVSTTATSTLTTITKAPKSTASKKKPGKPKTTTTTTTKKQKNKKPLATPKVGKRAEIFTVRPGVLAAASTTPAAAAATSSACQPQQNLYQYTPSDNSPKGFIADTNLAGIGLAAVPPAGYSRTFSNQFGSMIASNYITYYQLSAYDPVACSALCEKTPGCQSINIYFERQPIIDPGASCPNPTAGVNVRCALWGSQLTAAQATNVGQWRQQFMVVIQSSAGYVKNSAPAAVSGFTGPVALAGAVNVNTINGNNVLLASNYVSGTYNVSVCAAQCTALTASNKAAAVASGALSYGACNYFNAFSVQSNGTQYGYYCGLYTDAAVASYPQVYTSTYNSVTYDLTNSYGYALSTVDAGTLPRPQFKILSAFLADLNITALARSAFLSNSGTTLSIDTTFPGSAGLGSTDPWAGTAKTVTVLYTYGSNETRVFTSMINAGVFNQTNAYFTAATAPGSTLIPSTAAPAGATVKLQAVTYGPAQITTASVISAIYSAQIAKTSIPLENSFFGIDTLQGVVKSSVIFYTDAAGTQQALVGREHVYLTFP